MTAAVYLHPRSVETFGLFGMLSNLKTRGYEVPSMQGRFYRAFPEPLPPPIRPPATTSPAALRRLANNWWPRK